MQYPTYGPSGSTTAGPDLGYAVDSMGRLNTMTDLGSSSTIISSATYGNQGKPGTDERIPHS